MLNIASYFDDVEKHFNLEYQLALNLTEVLNKEEEYYKDYLEAYYNKNSDNSDSAADVTKISNHFYIQLRKHRDLIKNSFRIKKFLIGDVLEFNYFFKNAALSFSGICISIKKSKFVMPDVSLILRNVVIKTGIELIFAYFYNRAYNMIFLDYKRKFYTYNKTKLYFVRYRLNRESRID